MALISQSIKNLKGGISQQPDILRYPDQGSRQVNGWSSETEGLQKRPPLVFLKTLGDNGALGQAPYIHLINRDENEQYYAVFTGTGIRVFDLAGNEKQVRYPNGSNYIKTANPRSDLRMVTVADYTFIVNRNVVVQKDPNSVNLANYNPKQDGLINIRGGQYGRELIVHINGKDVAKYKIPDGSQPEHVNNTDAQWLAEELAKQMRTNLSGWTVNVGQGFIHVTAPSGQQIDSFTTKDGYADQLINPVTHYAQSFSKLPPNAPNGYMVKIVGDASKSADQYYVRYDDERKVWTETLGWNTENQVLLETMPHALVRAADGNFDFEWLEWSPKSCGDVDTNPWPSFVGSSINDVFFFRNRLGFLSGENIILSRTAKYFNFYPASIANLSNDDPIDVAVSTNRIAILKYAVPFSEELLIWSDEAQFVLTASGTLTSRSVELNLTTQFDVQDRARPYGIGRNVYFASPRSSYTSIHRYYAVQDVSSVKNSEDITSHVPNYIPNGVFSICGSGTENFCSVLSHGDPSKIFMYKFLYLNEELRQQSWSHWDFGENVQVLACQSISSDMYVILRNEFNTFLARISFTKNAIDLQGEPYRAFMDMKIRYTIPSGTYNDDTFTTSIHIPTIYGANFGRGKITVLEPDGKITVFEQPTSGWQSDPWLRLSGNLEGREVFIGFNINFVYEFSKFLIKQTADDGSTSTEDIGRLQLRRAWVNYEDSGTFDIYVENQSSNWKYTMAGARLGSNTLRAGRLNLGTGQYRFPVVGNAKFNTVYILSDETTPLNIIGCGWEGNYLQRSSGI
ncbi:tail fiber protein / T7-like tail tubular protein B [Yersinia phage YpsP-G]|uniref:Tail fiber protein / T7-like tail tubular protein B n=1 Tax=Yersinia phage YpsP-G TaxID=1176767 RepID=I6QAG4_9CAUD|nr:tail protein [Yersinia phage YpsP-G]AFK13529.1 tail fiber protein / T7-like tail tubular protein B [Yersinia phage YpsP-G]